MFSLYFKSLKIKNFKNVSNKMTHFKRKNEREINYNMQKSQKHLPINQTHSNQCDERKGKSNKLSLNKLIANLLFDSRGCFLIE